MPRININHLNLEPQEIEPSDSDLEISEKGPWKAVTWNGKIALMSDDFTHDVVLYITGDFYDDAQKLRYADLLADRMNRMPKE